MRTKFLMLGLVVGWALVAQSSTVVAQLSGNVQVGGLGPPPILGGRGVCVLLGDKDCQRAISVARENEWRIYVPLPTLEEVNAAARAADAAGLYGTRIFVEKQPPGRIGLADNVADIVLQVGDIAPVPKAEISSRPSSTNLPRCSPPHSRPATTKKPKSKMMPSSLQ